MERQHLLIFIELLAGYRAFYNLTKNTHSLSIKESDPEGQEKYLGIRKRDLTKFACPDTLGLPSE
jgi:hypothetical protein